MGRRRTCLEEGREEGPRFHSPWPKPFLSYLRPHHPPPSPTPGPPLPASHDQSLQTLSSGLCPLCPCYLPRPLLPTPQSPAECPLLHQEEDRKPISPLLSPPIPKGPCPLFSMHPSCPSGQQGLRDQVMLYLSGPLVPRIRHTGARQMAPHPELPTPSPGEAVGSAGPVGLIPEATPRRGVEAGGREQPTSTLEAGLAQKILPEGSCIPSSQGPWSLSGHLSP